MIRAAKCKYFIVYRSIPNALLLKEAYSGYLSQYSIKSHWQLSLYSELENAKGNNTVNQIINNGPDLH